MKHAQELLKQIGLEPERIRMFNMSSAMAGQFVSATQEMIQTVERTGLNPLRENNMANSKMPSSADQPIHAAQQILNDPPEVTK